MAKHTERTTDHAPRAKQTVTFRQKRTDAERRGKQAEKLLRVMKLLELLQGCGSWNPGSLARELRCSQREVHRLLNVLMLAGLCYEFDRTNGGYEPLRPGYAFAPLPLTEDELIGQAAATALSRVPALELGSGATAATRKLAALDPTAGETLALAQQVITALGPKTVDHSGHGDVLRAIQRALLQRKQLEATYLSPYATKPWKAVLHPYRLCLGQHAWYLIARPDWASQPLTLRVVRFRSLSVLEHAAVVPDDFDLRAYFGNAWNVWRGETTHDVEIRFTREAAAQVAETTWHATQQVHKHADGSATLSFRVDGLDEILWWLLAWTGFAEVIKPAELRELLVDQLDAGLRLNGACGRVRH
ncbi:MAG TPA: WYL domain-containing protein [Pirellulales bacterium]|nr:WYL domain-containing protein [Pirellulales bacterium]